MDIALLNRRVTFQKRSPRTDELGNRTSTWVDVYRCSATISGEAPGESLSEAGTADTAHMAITVRDCEAARDITTTGHRLVYGGAAWDITGIDHLSYTKRAIKFHATKTDKEEK